MYTDHAVVVVGYGTENGLNNFKNDHKYKFIIYRRCGLLDNQELLGHRLGGKGLYQSQKERQIRSFSCEETNGLL